MIDFYISSLHKSRIGQILNEATYSIWKFWASFSIMIQELRFLKFLYIISMYNKNKMSKITCWAYLLLIGRQAEVKFETKYMTKYIAFSFR